ncbi:esterase/lipase family protein [Massilia cavernae]|uniref:GPI inositol-deacylase PGAP1-like alpha/beta domain-containing protein n=1 Tax=Massilia cavernae TaxID=2320864 RepID=A0A418XTX6_9BURK|nr:hypothetical protein [Massilia cavernae]RJG16106.1 hypothetical protein D3872_11465 [Massilia cavernae]
MTIRAIPGYRLPTDPARAGGKATQGFVTPKQDRTPQVHSIPPRRVLPIIFLPGIMGSNLRMSAERQDELKKKNNIAWRPDNLRECLGMINATPAERQLRLDPAASVVDEYDPINNPTGDPNETSDERNESVEVDFWYRLDVTVDSPLLKDDPYGSKARKMKEQKARERGWGEVFFGSYRELLEMCEKHLNTAFFGGKMDSWWKQVVDVDPATWQAHMQPALKPLDEQSLRDALRGCWFPVHAMGYNWLQSNRDSGKLVANRIRHLMERYKVQGFQCEKVIIVTHSMGGLVARAAIHPKMGKLQSEVLGIVHGVMPAIGAGAAYKRMRCGFEDSTFDAAPKVLGNFGDEVTAVLANAQGGLELLPSQAYGNDWLRVTHKKETLKSLPKTGDPYEEIYKLRGAWYALLREEWINPAQREKDSSFKATCALLDKAKAFHNAIADTYHDQSYAHYGADFRNAAWHRVSWSIMDAAHVADVETIRIVADTRQGELHVVDRSHPSPAGKVGPQFVTCMTPPGDPGDQTVPLHSAEHQLRSGKFKGVFRQSGYEHQASYKDESALHSTLYSLVRIAQTMRWSK